MKRMLPLLLAAILCLSLLTACAKNNPADNTGSETANAFNDENWVSDIETLRFYLFDDSGKNAGNEEHVEAAINDILGPKLGINVDILFGDFGSYSTNLNLAISSNEEVDVAMLFLRAPANFASMYANKQLSDMTDVMNRYAPETLELLAPYLGATTFHGSVFGLPAYRIYATNPYVVFRADVLEQLGLEDRARACSSWSELISIWETIQTESGLYATTGGAITSSQNYTLGKDAWSETTLVDVPDALGLVMVKDNNAESLFGWEGYINDCKSFAEWNEKGLIYPDAILTDSLPDELISNNVVASYITSSETGIEATKEGNLGLDLTCVKICDGMIKGSNLSSWGVCIPVTCEYPEKAAAFINELYTNPDIINLIAWGVEGTDYVVKNGEACFPDDMTNATYHERDFLLGNQFLVYPWEGQGANFRELTLAENQAAPISKYLSFTFDSEGLNTIQGNLSAVVDQYQKDFRGGYYTDEKYEEFSAKFKTAGIDEYVAAVQTQLDAWLAENS
ncbi:MAG: ABC transporter substrate-binding protein [Oscillospiraceae bacterium]|nr:ABC transporter substrate-binding protein [Oscillospiraceae bacterium]